MNGLHISPQAQNDLAEIKDYITQELENPKAALRVVSKVLESIRMLREHAFLGAALNAVADVDSDYRFLVSGSYLVFYRVTGRNVYIDRILYGRRDYLRVLLGDASPAAGESGIRNNEE